MSHVKSRDVNLLNRRFLEEWEGRRWAVGRYPCCSSQEWQ